MSDSVWPHRWQPTRLLRPWDSPGKTTGVGCHFLLQCTKVKSKVKSLSRVQLLATSWTAAHHAPPSMGFSRQEYWSGVPLHVCTYTPISVWKVEVLVAQLCLTLCNTMDCSPPVSSVQGILQANILEGAAIPFSRGFFPLRDQTLVSSLQADSLPSKCYLHSHCLRRRGDSHIEGHLCRMRIWTWGQKIRETRLQLNWPTHQSEMGRVKMGWTWPEELERQQDRRSTWVVQWCLTGSTRGTLEEGQETVGVCRFY